MKDTLKDVLKDRVTSAESEAERFLKTVKNWKESHGAPKESGAMKRASMDLTRALVGVRKSPRKD